MPDLLLELFSEEIPARMQARAAEDLKKMVTDKLVDAGLVYEGAKAFATPRRLALTVQGVPAKQSDLKEERKGPRVGAPEGAIAGFLKAAGLSSIGEATIQKDPKKGDFYIALTEKPGRPAIDVIAEILQIVMRTFPWPKSMRWGAASVKSSSLEWVRPLHAIVATFGPETEEPQIVPLAIDGVASGDTTYGHRFLSPGAISVRRFDDYVHKLEKAKVVLDPARRREIILHDAKNLAFAQGLELVEDEALLNEVAGLVEWPVVLMGSFEDAFLKIPGEVIRATIRNNQKCFVVRDPKTGRLANRFILTSNTEAADGGKAIIAGNQRVIRARLSDAKFFYETDLKTRLEDRLPRFKGIVFHEKLGTQAERFQCVALLAGEIAPLVDADVEKAKHAGRLCEADLLTEVVGEFPEVQGMMGRHYALQQGEDPSIAAAIEEHWRPEGPDDALPVDPVSIAVALADKIGRLVAFWAINDTPTGSKDPYKLRRAALGVVRVLLETNTSLSLTTLFQKALVLLIQFGLRPRSGYRSLCASWDPQTEDGPKLLWSDSRYALLLNVDGFLDRHGEEIGMQQIGNPDLGGENDEDQYAVRSAAYKELSERLDHLDRIEVPFMFYDVDGEQSRRAAVTQALHIFREKEFARLAMRELNKKLFSYFFERLKGQLRDQGARHDLVDAVLANEGQDDLLLIVRRVEALGKFLATDDGKSLLAGVKRASNILRIEEKKDGRQYHGKPHPDLYLQPEERALAAAINAVKDETAKAVAREDFEGAMAVLAKLRPDVDAFFDKVTVNVEMSDRRENRLKLLNEIREATRAVADFSKVEG